MLFAFKTENAIKQNDTIVQYLSMGVGRECVVCVWGGGGGGGWEDSADTWHSAVLIGNVNKLHMILP